MRSTAPAPGCGSAASRAACRPLPASVRNGPIRTIGGRTRRIHRAHAAAGQPFLRLKTALVISSAEAIDAVQTQLQIRDRPALLLHPALTECRTVLHKALILCAFQIVVTRHPASAVSWIDTRRVHENLRINRLRLCRRDG